jgi:hypothetical protein
MRRRVVASAAASGDPDARFTGCAGDDAPGMISEMTAQFRRD